MKFLLVFLIAFFSSASNADNWIFNFQAETDLSYDDNVTMSNTPQESIVYKVLPTVTALYQNETFETTANAAYGTQRYIDIDGFDFILQEYDIKSIFHMETAKFGLSAGYKSKPNIESAQEDTGDFNTSSIRTVISVKPFFSHQFTDIDSIGVKLGYRTVTSTEASFADIDSKNINLIWSRQWTERLTSNLEIFYKNYEFRERVSSPISETISDNYGVSISTDFLINDRFSITGGIGFRHTDTEEKSNIGGTERRDSNGFITTIIMNYKGENLKASFSINRNLVPSSRGELNEQSSLALNLHYQITDNVYTSFLANYQKSDRENNNGNNNRKRTNINIKPAIHWRTTKHLLLSASYKYRFQDDSEDTFTAHSNTFMLSANFNYDYD